MLLDLVFLVMGCVVGLVFHRFFGRGGLSRLSGGGLTGIGRLRLRSLGPDA